MQTQQMKIMGIVNLTPDSFSDGGAYFDCAPDVIIDRALQLTDEGADVIDLGAESSRPGAAFLPLEVEWDRLRPILESCRKHRLYERAILSIDSNKPEVIRRTLDFGVRMINNIKGITDPETLEILARHEVSYVAMHMHALPQTMMSAALPPTVAEQSVTAFFAESHRALINAGFAPDRIWLDPGVGFGKSDPAILRILQLVPGWSQKYQVAIGISRKSFLGRLLSIEKPQDRDPCSKAIEAGLFLAGAKMIRTHQVKALAQIRCQLRHAIE